MKFTPLQVEELTHKLEVRRETIADDPDSADEYETVSFLDALDAKIKGGRETELSTDELDWLTQEAKNLQSIGDSNLQYDSDWLGYSRSMSNLVKKLNKFTSR
jgi:hypothetical protein